MKDVETSLVQQGMEAHRARVKLAWRVLHEAHGKVGKAVLSETARDETDEAMLGKITLDEVNEVVLIKIHAKIRHDLPGGDVIRCGYSFKNCYGNLGV